MDPNRLLGVVAFLAVTQPSFADETAPTVRSTGGLKFQVWLRLPAARGHYQPRISFNYPEFFPAPKIVQLPDTYYRDESGEEVAMKGVLRDGPDLHYALKTEESYLAFRTITNAGAYIIGWNAWDSKGTNFRFEDLDGTREAFLLRTVTDANGNRTEYRYTGTRLTSIEYNFYDPANPTSTAAVPTNATAFASSVEFDYDAAGRIFGVRANNRSASGMSLVRGYEWKPDPSSANTRWTFTEITQGSLRRLDTSFEYRLPSWTLRAITTPRGARYDVTQDSLGRVASFTVSGPGLQPVTTRYWHLRNQTVSQDDVTRIARSVWWEPQMRDTPARVDWGTETVPGNSTTPPQYTAFKQRFVEHTWREIDTGACVAPVASSQGVMLAQAPPAGASIPIASRERETIWIDGNAMSRERTVACPSGIDAYGNITSTRVDLDLARGGDEYDESFTFAAQTPSHSCSDCMLTRSAKDLWAQLLSYERYVYDSFAHVKELWHKEQPASAEQLVTAWDFNGNGSLRVMSLGAVSTSLTYDTPYQLRVTGRSVRGAPVAPGYPAGKALVTDFGYDAFGNQELVTGPYLADSAPAPRRGLKYDDAGRVVAVARQPISGSLVTDGIAAFEYADSGTAPSQVTAYSFAVPKTFTVGAVPQTSDVVQTSIFLDALGREIQIRQRLGGSGTGDAGAHVVDDLGPTAFRVSHVMYDGAGRVTAALEPFYAPGAEFVDYRTNLVTSLSSTPGHARLRTYDARGRLTCETYRPIASGGAIPPPGPCVSNFTEGPTYARATATSFRWSGGYLGIKVIPPENNLPSYEGGPPATPEGRAATGPESMFDASGRLGATHDVDGNATVYTYDPLGRVTRIDRHPSVSVSGRPSAITSTLTYSLMGRLIERTDPNVGTRTIWYDPQGQVIRVQLPQRDLGSGVKGRDEVQIDYDMGRPSTTRTCVATSPTAVSCTPDWALTYDTPFDASFTNVAGRIAYAQKAGVATVKFGYSPEGGVTRRAYELAGNPGTFDLSDTVLLDGRVTGSALASASGSVTVHAQKSHEIDRLGGGIDTR